MSKSDGTFILVATYPDERAAREDYQVVKEAHAHGLVGSYDAALVTKDMNGKIHENKDETGTRHGTWWGIAAGAVVGVLFPPSIIGAAALGGVIGAVSGHVAKGMSRAQAKELGDFIDPGEAGLLVVGESTTASCRKRSAGPKAKRAHAGVPGHSVRRPQSPLADVLSPAVTPVSRRKRSRAAPALLPGAARASGRGSRVPRVSPTGLAGHC